MSLCFNLYYLSLQNQAWLLQLCIQPDHLFDLQRRLSRRVSTNLDDETRQLLRGSVQAFGADHQLFCRKQSRTASSKCAKSLKCLKIFEVCKNLWNVQKSLKCAIMWFKWNGNSIIKIYWFFGHLKLRAASILYVKQPETKDTYLKEKSVLISF